MSNPSVVFMGSKPGSVVALRMLLARGWNVRYVVVSENIKHPWVAGPTLEEEARRMGLEVLAQSSLPRSEKVDFIISYMFRCRVKSDVLSLAEKAAVNFHAGPLPEFGGWAFYNVAIMENATEYGCTSHYMDNGFDTGPLLKVSRFQIDPSNHTAWSLEKKTQREMIGLFADFLDMVDTGQKLPKVNQEKRRMRYMTKDQFSALKEIPHNADAESIDRIARAFWYPPYECAFFKIGDSKIEVVPELAKIEIACLLHGNDFNELLESATDSGFDVSNVKLGASG